METGHSTCWMVIRGAKQGRDADRNRFTRRYMPIVRSYLQARWSKSSMAIDVDDATQAVFSDCFRLDAAGVGAPGSFRPRSPGLDAGGRGALRASPPACTHGGGGKGPVRAVRPRLCRRGSRGGARASRGAGRAPATRPHASAPNSCACGSKRKLRIEQIARRWGVDAETLHDAYTRAKEEFRRALIDVVAFHHGGTRDEVVRECGRLLALI